MRAFVSKCTLSKVSGDSSFCTFNIISKSGMNKEMESDGLLHFECRCVLQSILQTRYKGKLDKSFNGYNLEREIIAPVALQVNISVYFVYPFAGCPGPIITFAIAKNKT